jgi:hypothetical protein
MVETIINTTAKTEDRIMGSLQNINGSLVISVVRTASKHVMQIMTGERDSKSPSGSPYMALNAVGMYLLKRNLLMMY